MARENPTWGEGRIADELLLKLGLQVSPRTIRKYLPKWMADYNRGRPHTALGSGIPGRRLGDLPVELCGYSLPLGHQVVAKPILGGLHHEYGLQKAGGMTLPRNDAGGNIANRFSSGAALAIRSPSHQSWIAIVVAASRSKASR
jgi:hypothetical protein